MPGGDGTGPAGMGPMTGRAAGYCAGFPVPGYVNPMPGRGFGGGGRGRRNWYYATGMPGWARAAQGMPASGVPGPGYPAPAYGPYGPTAQQPGWAYPPPAYGAYGPTPEQEVEFLKQQSEALQQQLEQISQRMAELEKEGEK